MFSSRRFFCFLFLVSQTAHTYPLEIKHRSGQTGTTVSTPRFHTVTNSMAIFLLYYLLLSFLSLAFLFFHFLIYTHSQSKPTRTRKLEALQNTPPLFVFSSPLPLFVYRSAFCLLLSSYFYLNFTVLFYFTYFALHRLDGLSIAFCLLASSSLPHDRRTGTPGVLRWEGCFSICAPSCIFS